MAAEAADDDAALERLRAQGTAHLAALDDGYAAAAAAIRGSMKRLKDMAKQYAR